MGVGTVVEELEPSTEARAVVEETVGPEARAAAATWVESVVAVPLKVNNVVVAEFLAETRNRTTAV